MIDLDYLEKLERDIFPGKWILEKYTCKCCSTVAVESSSFAGYDPILYVSNKLPCVNIGNGVLIVAMRNSLPALIAELRAARAIVDSVKSFLKHGNKDYALEEDLRAYDEAIKQSEK